METSEQLAAHIRAMMLGLDVEDFGYHDETRTVSLRSDTCHLCISSSVA